MNKYKYLKEVTDVFYYSTDVEEVRKQIIALIEENTLYINILKWLDEYIDTANYFCSAIDKDNCYNYIIKEVMLECL